MRKIIFIPFIFSLVGCSLFGEEPESTDYANVWDPNSDFYKPPETKLLDKPASLIKEHTTTFVWTSTRTGSPTGTSIDTSEYVNIRWSYSLNGGEFTDASTVRTVTFTYLTDTLNSFDIRTHYPNGEIEDPPTHHEFKVDNIKGPTLRFHPRKYDDAAVGISFIMEIYAEEVTGLTGAKIVLNYSPDSLSIGSISPPADSLFFLSPNGESTLFLESLRSDSNSIGSITLNMALAGADTKSVSGTGKLAILTVTPLISGTSFITFDSSSIYRDSKNKDIVIQDSSLVEGIIIAE